MPIVSDVGRITSGFFRQLFSPTVRDHRQLRRKSGDV